MKKMTKTIMALAVTGIIAGYSFVANAADFNPINPESGNITINPNMPRFLPNVVIGGNANGAANVAQASGTVIVGSSSNAPYGGVTVGSQSTTTDDGVTLGDDSSSQSGVAIGNGAVTTTKNGTNSIYGNITENTGTAVGISAHGRNGGNALGGNADANDQSTAVGNNAISDTQSVSNGFDSGSSEHSVSVGSYSNSASNGVAVGTHATATNNGVALGANSTDTDGQVSVGGGGVTRRIENVSAGVASTDAVNVSQLKNGLANTLNEANNYTNKTVAAINKISNYTIENPTTAQPFQTKNALANSVSNYVNVKSAQTLHEANAYTDSRIAGLNDSVQNVQDTAEAGIAAAMAMSQITIHPNDKYSAGLGIAGYGSQSAMAVGMKVDEKNAIFSLSSSYDTMHHFGVAAGATLGWS